MAKNGLVAAMDAAQTARVLLRRFMQDGVVAAAALI